MKSRMVFLLRILVTVGLFFVLFKLIPYKDLKEQIANANLIIIGFAFLQFFLLYFLGALRWQMILRASGIFIKYKDTFYLLICGLFFNLFCPSVVAADVFRASMITGASTGNNHSGTKTASTVILDRISGFVGLFLVSGLAVLLAPSIVKEPEVLLSLAVLFVILIGLCGFILSKRVAKFCIFFVSFIPKFKILLLKLSGELLLFRRNPLLFLKTVIVSIFIHFGVVVTYFICSKAFGMEVSLVYFSIVVPVVLVLSVLPISIAGLGTRDVGSVYFLTRVGVAKASALGLSLVNFVFFILSGIIGGILYVAFSNRWLQRSKQNDLFGSE